MILFLVNRIIKGQTTFAKVPQSLKEAVAEVLRQKGREDLIKEN